MRRDLTAALLLALVSFGCAEPLAPIPGPEAWVPIDGILAEEFPGP